MESSTSNSTAQVKACVQCGKHDQELRRCAKCKSATYCNRDCQKAHWKVHKKRCAHLAGESHPDINKENQSKPKSLDPHIKPFHRLHHNTYLHNIPQETTFKILIDTIRMRQEDTYKFERDTMPGTIYNMEKNSSRALRTMLKKASKHVGLLPCWWTDEKTDECVKYGLRRDHQHSLYHAVEKGDVQEIWRDDLMPMKLRMLSDVIYGNHPGCFGKEAMMTMMLEVEKGQTVMSHLSM